MKISVLTPSFNAAGTIARTLDSFCAQDWPDRELIVLDGASRDGTQDLVAGYARDGVRLVSAPDRGMYDALNRGLGLFTGDAVGVLNADDAYASSGALRQIAGALEGADMVHGSLVFRDGSGRAMRHWRAQARPAGGFRSGWMPAHPTFYVRRRVADTVGRYDVSLRIASDYDWMLRAVELTGFSLATLEDELIDMALGGASTRSLGAYVDHNLEALAARRRWLGAGLADYALIAKPARKIGQFLKLAGEARRP